MLSMGGRVLYSEAACLDGESPIYYLGINPRDAPSSVEPDHHSIRSIQRDLELFAAGRTVNGYLDESWKGSPPGTAPLQRRVRTLASWAGIGDDASFRRTPSSNVAFPRTVAQPADDQFKSWAAACWPVHELVLAMTGARTLLVGGTSAGRAVLTALGGDTEGPTFHCNLRTANYSLSVYRIARRVVFVLPPLPRWSGMETVDAEMTRAALVRFGS